MGTISVKVVLAMRYSFSKKAYDMLFTTTHCAIECGVAWSELHSV